MKLPSDPEVAAWLEKALGDLHMAQLACDADRSLWDQACFHSQQAAEKALKAMIVAYDLDLPRTHDLVFLVQLLKDRVKDSQDLEEHATVLTPYGVASRYPSLLASETEAEAREALRLATELCRWARRVLGSS